MDFRVVWSPSALQDLRELVRYISRDNRQVAQKFGNLIISKVDVLSEFPRVGREVPEFGIDTLRQIGVSPYRIVYEIDDQAAVVAILRVWHGARDRLTTSDLKPSN